MVGGEVFVLQVHAGERSTLELRRMNLLRDVLDRVVGGERKFHPHERLDVSRWIFPLSRCGEV